jgi:hypothetical protein
MLMGLRESIGVSAVALPSISGSLGELLVVVGGIVKLVWTPVE